jgi:hypothetical protein
MPSFLLAQEWTEAETKLLKPQNPRRTRKELILSVGSVVIYFNGDC